MKKVIVISVLIGFANISSSYASFATLGILPALSKDFRSNMDDNCNETPDAGQFAACSGSWILGVTDNDIQVAFNYISADSPLVREGVANRFGYFVKIDDESVRQAYNSLLENDQLSQMVNTVNRKMIGVNPNDSSQIALNLKKALEEILAPSPTVPEINAIKVFFSLYYGVTFSI